MPYQHLSVSVQDRIATLTVNRPDKLNALNATLIGELGAAIDEMQTRDEVAGIILTGAGRAFVAGADIAELSGISALEGKRLARRGQEIFRRFELSPKPTVAAVNGFALGGGCELAMACQIRIASDAAKFGQPEVKLGLIPGYGGTQRLPRLVGRGRAIQLLLTGEMIDAQEAFRIGLVNRVVAPEQLLPAATAMIQQMLIQSAATQGMSAEASALAMREMMRKNGGLQGMTDAQATALIMNMIAQSQAQAALIQQAQTKRSK